MSKSNISDKNLADKKKYKIPFYSKSKKSLSSVLLAGLLASSSSLGGPTSPASLVRLSDFLKSNSMFSSKNAQSGRSTRNNDTNNPRKKPFLDTDNSFIYKKPFSQKLTDFSSSNGVSIPNFTLSQPTAPVKMSGINKGSKPYKKRQDDNVFASDNDVPETKSIDFVEPADARKRPKPPALLPDPLSEGEKLPEIDVPFEISLLTSPQVTVAQPQAQAPNPIAAALDPLPNRVMAHGEVVEHVAVAVAQPQAQAPNPIPAALDPLPNRVVAHGGVSEIVEDPEDIALELLDHTVDAPKLVMEEKADDIVTVSNLSSNILQPAAKISVPIQDEILEVPAVLTSDVQMVRTPVKAK